METLGEKLKSLREEKGMTLKDVAKAIKVRESILSALENEEWDKLPQRIFVKGFVRAYARVVEGDEELVLDLFESSCPLKDAAISCPSFETQPHESLGEKKKKYAWIIVTITLILLVGGTYLVVTRFYKSIKWISGKKAERVETTVVKPPGEEKQETVTVVPNSTIPGSTERPAESVTASPSLEEKGSSSVSPGGGQASIPAEKKTANTTVRPVPPEKAEGGKGASQTAEAQPLPKDNLIITAKMETWIGLKIGGKLRKQVLLKPGETFSTRVEKSVELLIGNAGGIDIIFNGKKLEDIGKPGQVVRLKLPLEGNR